MASSKPQPLPSEWRRRSLLKVRRPSWAGQDPQRAATAERQAAASAPRAS